MIFYQFTSKLLDTIDLIIEYHLNEIEISIKWSSISSSFTKYTLSYIDDECTLPSTSPLFYLCSSSSSSPSKTNSLNSTFYSYWFLLDHLFYHRLFSHLTVNEDHFILLLSLPDGRLLVLPEFPQDSKVIIWYTSSTTTHPIQILAIDYDLNTNLLDAILSSNGKRNFPKLIFNHLILCEYHGSIILLNSNKLQRILLDNTLYSACIYLNSFIYLTKNEIRSITLTNLFKSNHDDILNQTKILRFGHFEKLLVDGQEIILYYQNGTFERLNNLLPRNTTPSRINSLSNQIKKLTCLTNTITNLQTNACQLQRICNKLEIFYQLNVKYIHHQWKLILNEQQLRIFQPNDFLLILVCHLSSNDIRIYQLIPTNNWTFKLEISMAYLCQPILFFRNQKEIFGKLIPSKVIVPFQEEEEKEEMKYPILKNPLYHITLTLRNEAAMNFKKMNMTFPRRLGIGRMEYVNIECKQQEMKVDTDAGLVDALTVQIILSSSCLRRLILVYSALMEVFYGNEEKNFIKQSDVNKLIERIQETQTKFSTTSDVFYLNLLQIRIYFSMFRLGSNYTVQVY